MARAFNAHCELGVVFNQSSSLLQSIRKSILSKVVISMLLQRWLYVAWVLSLDSILTQELIFMQGK